MKKIKNLELDPTTPLHVAREKYSAEMFNGVSCPCCNQVLKAKKIQISPQAAATAILLGRTFPAGTVVDIPHFLQHGLPQNGTQFAEYLLKDKGWESLHFWGILEDYTPDKKEKKRLKELYPDSKTRKYRKVTDRTYPYANGVDVVKFVLVDPNGQMCGWEDEPRQQVWHALEKLDYPSLTAMPLVMTGHLH